MLSASHPRKVTSLSGAAGDKKVDIILLGQAQFEALVKQQDMTMLCCASMPPGHPCSLHPPFKLGESKAGGRVTRVAASDGSARSMEGLMKGGKAAKRGRKEGKEGASSCAPVDAKSAAVPVNGHLLVSLVVERAQKDWAKAEKVC